MTGTLYIEWVRDGTVYGETTIAVTSTSAQSAAPPSFASGLGGVARVRAEGAAIMVAIGANPTANNTTSWRLDPGDQQAFAVGPADLVAAILSTTTAGGQAVTDAAAETSLSTVATNTGAAATSAAAIATSAATIATAQGAAGTGIAQPTGGSGVLGWLSGIYNALKGTLAVQDSAAETSVSTISSEENTGQGFIDMPVDGTTYTAGRWFQAECTIAGNVKVTAADASTRTVPLQVGLNILAYAVTKWTVSGVTGAATATYCNVK